LDNKSTFSLQRAVPTKTYRPPNAGVFGVAGAAREPAESRSNDRDHDRHDDIRSARHHRRAARAGGFRVVRLMNYSYRKLMIAMVPGLATDVRASRKSKSGKQPAPAPPPRSVQLSPLLASSLPLLFALALVALGMLKSVRQNPILLWSFLGASAALLAGAVGLLVSAARSDRRFRLDISLRKQH
jgi:hypothetical protein